MGTFNVSTSDNLTVKLWANRLYLDSIKGQGLIADMRSDGILVEEKSLSSGAGDRVRKTWSQRLSGKGIIGDNPIGSSLTDLDYATDDIVINKLSRGVKAKAKGSISQQRTNFALDEAAYPVLSDWFKQRMIAGAFNQLGGNSATSLTFDGDTYTGDERLAITGMQLPTAPTSARVLYAGSSDSSDADVNSNTSEITLQNIDDLVDLAMTQTAGVNNFKMILGKPYQFKLYVGVKGYKSLIQQASANGIMTLSQMELQNMAGGKEKAFIGRSFEYNRTQIVEVPDHYIANGNTGGTVLANVKRALFCGAEAGCLAFGQGFTDAKGDAIAGFNIVKDPDDFEEENRLKVTGIFGIKKAVVDSQDQSVITLSYYSA